MSASHSQDYQVEARLSFLIYRNRASPRDISRLALALTAISRRRDDASPPSGWHIVRPRCSATAPAVQPARMESGAMAVSGRLRAAGNVMNSDQLTREAVNQVRE